MFLVPSMRSVFTDGPLPAHGFARTSRWTLVSNVDATAVFELRESPRDARAVAARVRSALPSDRRRCDAYDTPHVRARWTI